MLKFKPEDFDDITGPIKNWRRIHCEIAHLANQKSKARWGDE